MRLPKLREPAPCLLQILAIASCVQRHAQRPPALSTSYQPHSPAVTQACRKLTIAAAAVVDGAQDNGIDALYYDAPEKVCYLIQAKWVDSGNGSVEVGDVQKFVQGCKDLLEPRLDRFNEKVRRKRDTIMAALEDSSARFVMVIAYTGQQPLSQEALRPLGDLLENLNDPSELVSLQVLSQSELHRLAPIFDTSS